MPRGQVAVAAAITEVKTHIIRRQQISGLLTERRITAMVTLRITEAAITAPFQAITVDTVTARTEAATALITEVEEASRFQSAFS